VRGDPVIYGLINLEVP